MFGSPFQVHVLPSDASAPHCTISPGPALSSRSPGPFSEYSGWQVEAGAQSEFTIKEFDCYGNPVLAQGALGARGQGVTASSSSKVVGPSSSSSVSPFHVQFIERCALHNITDGAVSPCGDGTHACAFRVLRSGEYDVHVELRSVPLKGSPFLLEVFAAARTDPLQCRAEGEGLLHASSRTPATFVVQACDEYGNMRLKGEMAARAQRLPVVSKLPHVC